MEKKIKTKKAQCCTEDTKRDGSTIRQGIIYGLIPHTGCIAFIIASVFGVTVATQIFKPLLLNPYFFYILILMSFIFATISAIFYLKRHGFITLNKDTDGLGISFSKNIIQSKWKYLSTLYGTTISVNLLLFMVIFPLLANASPIFTPSITGSFAGATGSSVDDASSVRLKVDIPCSGHAPLITGELKTINGVLSVQFSFPNIFDVKFDPTKTSNQQILSLDVFKTYKATVLDVATQQANQQTNNQTTSGGCCGSGGCGCGAR